MGKDYFTRSQLLERRWTLGAINKFLREPDVTCANPHCRRMQMYLYRKSRVEAAEQSAEFIAWLTKSAGRRLAASTAAISRAKAAEAALTEAARDAAERIVVPRMKPEHLRQAALSVHDHDGPLDTATLERWCVNFLRHSCTPYDYLNDSDKGLVGKNAAYKIRRSIVLRKIAEVYPWLAFECECQDYL